MICAATTLWEEGEFMQASRLISILGLFTLILASSALAGGELALAPVGLHNGLLSATQGDTAFTLYLEQNKEVVTGSVSSPMGGAEITSGSFKRKFLELQITTDRGNYVIMGKLEKGQMSGTWSLDNVDKGTWEGKKAAASN